MEERGGKKEKKREEDRRWQRLPWPGPHSFAEEPNFQAFGHLNFERGPDLGPYSSRVEPNHEALGPHSFGGETNVQCSLSSSMELNYEQTGPPSSCGQLYDQPLLENTELKKNFPAIGCNLATGKPTCYHPGTQNPPDRHLGSTWKPGCHHQTNQNPPSYHHHTTWKAPGYHLVATILIALLSMLVRPTVGGKDKH